MSKYPSFFEQLAELLKHTNKSCIKMGIRQAKGICAILIKQGIEKYLKHLNYKKN